jgi:CRISPR-associated protein Csc1
MTAVLQCDLELHDSLYFASREIGRLYETERVIHNYALCYALGLVTSPYFIRQQTPTYRQDLAALNECGIYVTPARPLAVDFMLNTWKYASNHYHVKMEKAQTNTPGFGRVKELSAESRFRFYVFTRNEDYQPPRWIRLGKWMSKARLIYQPLTEVQVKTGEFEVGHPLNPLDVFAAYTVTLCDLINMPPVSLITNAQMTGEHFAISADGQTEICLPKNLRFNFERKP